MAKTALTEIVQTVQKFSADDPILSVAVLISLLLLAVSPAFIAGIKANN